MINILNADDIREIMVNNEEHKEALSKVLSLMESGNKIQVRKSTTAKGTFVRIYTYDRFLYRYICSLVIEIN